MPSLKKKNDRVTCSECKNGAGLNFQFTMAFQPIIDSTTRKVFSQEALIRGLDQETAFDILSPITDENRYQFDQACRVKAIDDLGAGYSGLNFLAKFQPDIIKLEFP